MEPTGGIWRDVDNFIKDQYIPLHMMLEVSRKCNINCVHCYNIKDKAHLSFAQIDDIFRQLREAGTLFLTLTGGEFFARPDAVDILYLAREYGFDIRLITNGTMITKGKAKVLREINPLEVGISVLGATAETHDRLARVPGAFVRTIDGIKHCIEEKVPVHIKCTLMNENFHEFKDIIRLAKSLGIVYMIDPVVTPRDDGDTQNLEHRLRPEYLEQFYTELFSSVDGDDDDLGYEDKEKGLPCEAGTGFGSISADGSVYPCVQMPKEVGNVFEGRFKDIWEKATFLYRLRNVKKDEFNNCSGCQGGCSRCPGLAYLETGDPFGPSSIACTIGEIYKKYDAQQKGIEFQPKESCGSNCACSH